MSSSYIFFSPLNLSRSNCQKYEPINVDYNIISYFLFFEFPYLFLILKNFTLSLFSRPFTQYGYMKTRD